MMQKNDKILILGARGLAGSAILREFQKAGYTQLLTPSHQELELLSQAKVLDYFSTHKPQHVVLAAAKVGGIHYNNTHRADFIFENLGIQNNVFEASFKNKIEKLLFLGSSCIYPKNAPQPMKEEYLLTSPLEPTNEPYAIAKIAGLKTAESFRRQYGCNYISVMPTNLYGINDTFHEENSHVIPALIVRMKRAIETNQPQFEVWGTGKPRREFLCVDDMARACRMIMEFKGEVPDLINIGYGTDVSISELAHLIKELMGYKGELVFNTSRPDGPMQKLLDISRLKEFGWKPEVNLRDGLKQSIDYFLTKTK